MPNNNPNISIPINQWVDLYALTGITVGDPLHIKNIGVSDIFLAVQATRPDNDHAAYDIIERNDDIAVANNSGDSGAWAYSNATKGLLSVASTASEGFRPALKVMLTDGFGNPISSLKGAIDVHNADVHNSVINKYVRRYTGISTTLTTATTGDGTEYTIDVADVAGFALNDFIEINTADVETTMPRILASTVTLPGSGPGTFTLDRRLDIAHNIGDTVSVAVTDMSSITATLASPVTYYVEPFGSDVWHLTRLIFEMTHGTAGDLGLFGNLSALINGVILRIRINGQYFTFTNWKQNSNIKTDMFDVVFDSRSGGGGSFGTTGRGTFLNIGSVVRLDGALGDRFEVLIQDDIIALESFTMKLQGHAEGA